MKHFCFSILLLLAVLAGTVSCVHEEEVCIKDQEINDSSHPLLTYLSLHNKGTRNSDKYSVTPIISESDTVMFVVQYADGWELYSSDFRFPMLIMKSSSGVFNQSIMPDATQLQIAHLAQTIHNTIQTNENLPIDSSWNWLNPQFEEVETQPTRTNDEKPDFSRPGEWVLIDVIDHGIQTHRVPHLVKTKWGQRSPWDSFIPIDKDSVSHPHSAVGCTVVATAQYAYYLHSKDGIPASAPTIATYDVNSNWFTFSNFTSDAWKSMALKYGGMNAHGAAVYIGYVASEIVPPSYFHYSGTGVKVERAISHYLKPATNLEFINNKLEIVKISNVIKEIENRYPVIAVGYDGNGKNAVGHTFLIDSYLKETHTFEYVYGWDGYTLSGKDPNFRDRDGNITIYGIQKSVTKTQSNEYFGMNWGYNGSYDDILTSISSWRIGSTYYNYNQEVALRKQN